MKRLALLLLFGTALGWGQWMDDFAWWDSPISQNLNLTPDQHKQIQATIREFRDRLIEQRASVQKAEANLTDLMNDDQVNEAKTREMIDKVVAARSDLMRTVSLMSLRLRMVLTPQQWQELRRRRAQQLAQRRGPAGEGLGPAMGPAQPFRGQPQGGFAMSPARRQQILQRLRQLQRRMQQGADLTPADRQQILDRLRQIEQLLGGQPAIVEQGPPPPGAAAPKPAPAPQRF